MEKELGMEKETVESIVIEQVKPVIDKKMLVGKGKITIVILSSIDERDAIFSYATNLDGGASLDVVIPNCT